MGEQERSGRRHARRRSSISAFGVESRPLKGGLSAKDRQILLDRAAEHMDLTDHQKRIVALLVFTSLPRKQVADWMGVSKDTLDTHIRRLFRRFDLEARIELVRYVYESGLKALD